ncbi:MAG TPA: AAA family ATPase [Saprospiraceae bacterium]|nr:AAA family ATPase [Saprospiraceae bacterium]
MTRMTIVCGLPGTGKSTFALALAESIGAVHLNTDRVRHALGRQGQYSLALKSAIYDSLLLRAREALNAGKDVVLDGTFYKEKLRRTFILLAEELQVPVHWIEMVASEKTVRERVSKTRPYTEADYSVYQKIKNEFDPLPPGRLTLDSDILKVDDMVRLAKEYIHVTNLAYQ